MFAVNPTKVDTHNAKKPNFLHLKRAMTEHKFTIEKIEKSAIAQSGIASLDKRLVKVELLVVKR